ncbi:MAG: NAD(P)/FAD-dependent oxidoreductase [Cyanobacteria bacterium J06642_2]
MFAKKDHQQPHRVTIVGGGFGGLYAAKELGSSPYHVTLLDRRNFHLFQPLLYQVATGGLSAGDISSPLRAVLNQHKNVQVLMGEMRDIDPDRKRIILTDGELSYDTAIVATGTRHHYFGNDDWEERAPSMKTIEDALEVRRRIFSAFEAAEKETDPVKRQAWLTFVVVGAGPTGVELAGALAELAHGTLVDDFRSINTSDARIILLEGADRVLPPYPIDLSERATRSLETLGVEIRTSTFVTQINDDAVRFRSGDREGNIATRTTLWAAGVKASKIGRVIAERTGVEIDRTGRVMVAPDLSIPEYPDLFVIGDLAHYAHQDEGKPLPGLAPVAMQQGRYVARLLQQRWKGKTPSSFHYAHQGSLAVIGRHAAVADLGRLKIAGWSAWFVWTFVHIYYLVEFDNKLLVLMQWGWNYFTRKRGARLITGPSETFSAADGAPEPSRKPIATGAESNSGS